MFVFGYGFETRANNSFECVILSPQYTDPELFIVTV